MGLGRGVGRGGGGGGRGGCREGLWGGRDVPEVVKRLGR